MADTTAAMAAVTRAATIAAIMAVVAATANTSNIVEDPGTMADPADGIDATRNSDYPIGRHYEK